MIPGGLNPMWFLGGDSYQIQRSVRLRSSNNASLTRTFTSSGDPIEWTFSAWIKRGVVGVSSPIFDAGTSNYLRFNSADQLELVTAGVSRFITGSAFRDTSAWYHIVLGVRSFSGTPRWGLFVNGVSQLGLITSPTSVFNTAVSHGIGRSIGGGTFDGYIAEVVFISNYGGAINLLGQNDPVTGKWTARKYPTELGYTYGSNGFYLPFSNVSNLTTVCNDHSGNSLHWTQSGLSNAAGASNDLMVDVPLARDTIDRGSYATLNPAWPGASGITNGNLRSGTTNVRSTHELTAFAGAYWEVTAGAGGATAGAEGSNLAVHSIPANKTFAFRLTSAGSLDARNVTDGGAWFTMQTGYTAPTFAFGSTQAADWNFGQTPFFGAQSGKALHTGNIPDGVVTLGGTFTGTGIADGPFIWMNGTPLTLTINGNAVTFGTHARKLAGGFKVITASASYNDPSFNFWSATVSTPANKAAMRNQLAQINP